MAGSYSRQRPRLAEWTRRCSQIGDDAHRVCDGTAGAPMNVSAPRARMSAPRRRRSTDARWRVQRICDSSLRARYCIDMTTAFISQDHARRQRSSVRRSLTAIALVFTGLVPSLAKATDEPASHAGVTVHEERGVYMEQARFHVAQPPAVALAALMDYEQIPRFMPGVTTSVVLERATGRAVVEQEAIWRVMMFSKRVDLVLEITEGTDTLRFRDRCGRSFARYEGMWQTSAQDGGTDIIYELTAQPSFAMPEFLLTRLLRRDSGEMIEGLRREIAARSLE